MLPKETVALLSSPDVSFVTVLVLLYISSASDGLVVPIPILPSLITQILFSVEAAPTWIGCNGDSVPIPILVTFNLDTVVIPTVISGVPVNVWAVDAVPVRVPVTFNAKNVLIPEAILILEVTKSGIWSFPIIPLKSFTLTVPEKEDAVIIPLVFIFPPVNPVPSVSGSPVTTKS